MSQIENACGREQGKRQDPIPAVHVISNCPLCGDVSANPLESIPFERIWSSLRTRWGAVFSPEIMQRHTPAPNISLLECQRCGLQYFNPAIPGDAEFYNQLMASSLGYSSERWDFLAAIEIIASGDKVLDIACGEGRFLQLAQAKGAVVCGIDINPMAVENAKHKGLSAYCVPLNEFASENRECFDVVTAFQVIEHLSDVQPFARAASNCLKPGGKFFITVPNRLRGYHNPFDPLDQPPHHLSRWTSDQLQTLAHLTGCNVSTIRYEPAGVHDYRALLRCRIGAEQSESLWARIIARIVFAPSLYQIYSTMGLLDRWHLLGMSVMGVFEKQR
ncbi:MAG: class I SAM-dependent methyltransferase [Candidatus Thiosymbion ectosymbiont of Robbea hypermnestra]|nr:class I SAM-dependent methyltransferase [Candidatus Thiosymbion ectosymbiont of Robbea hypermnestra]